MLDNRQYLSVCIGSIAGISFAVGVTLGVAFANIALISLAGAVLVAGLLGWELVNRDNARMLAERIARAEKLEQIVDAKLDEYMRRAVPDDELDSIRALVRLQ